MQKISEEIPIARIECYIPDGLKDKINELATRASLSTSKYVTQVLEMHCAGGDNNNAVFQKKVMAALCDIYACVFDPTTRDVNYSSALNRMQEIKQQCEKAVLTE